ncbi:hypothetical protein EWM64_g8448 [Hericium alpestre]|uniref:EXPERA domain-containing protein n=1 Tax=Hericium alpestre TaxID=135208 RepID=A0A4Y9ZLB6_9AGAM|nr:hypothetical protein EWM64_g8448 [Hericium alpestre]
MAPKTYTWISLWFLLTTPVILWDAFYCFFRPRSMVGGDLHWIWQPYSIYQEIDYVYGIKALEDNNGFTNAQSFLNLVETLMNVSYLYLAHVSGWQAASLVGYTGAVMTFSKTVLYWLQEYYCGGCSVGHNNLQDLLVYWVLPNSLWLLLPGSIIYTLGRDIAASINTASRVSQKETNGKKQ